MNSSTSESRSRELEKTGSSLGSPIFWMVTIVFNGCFVYLIYLLFGQPNTISEPPFILYGLAGVVGVVATGLLIKAARNVFHFWRYGSSILQLETNPGILGGP